MPTLKDVADLSGVTVTTVSRMLNNKVNVSDKTKRKIYEAMKALNYTPNEVARSLIMQKSNVIGLIVPSAKNFFFAEVIHYIEEFVSAHQYKLLLCVSDLNREKENEYFTMLNANRVSGVILASRTQDVETFINFKAPILTLERTLSDSIPSISSDSYAGASLVATHLVESGCKNLAYIGVSPELEMEGNKRLSGFRDTLKNNAVDDPVVINATERSFIGNDYKAVVDALFRDFPRVDGVFTSNEVIALQIIQHAQKNCIAIPDRLKVVGYDDTTLSSLCAPPLTSVRQPILEMCKAAVENIIMLSEGKTVPSKVVFPASLIVRGSSR